MSDFSKKLSSIFANYHSFELMRNVDAKISTYNIKGTVVISAIVDRIKESNCYIVSPFNLMINYSKYELIKLDSKISRYFSLFLIFIFKFILKLSQIDKVQTLNNYMLSTNFFSKTFEEINLKDLEKIAITVHPKHSLIIRSINKLQNPKLYDDLVKNDWIPFVSRQVYIFENFTKCESLKNFKSDISLLKDERYVFKEVYEHDFELCKEAERLYNQLYLYKYTNHNINFKAIYFQELIKNKLLHMKLLFDTREDRYVGVIGLIGESDILTAPIVGYDLSYNIKEALYRRVIAYALLYAKDKKAILNLSSGAPYFKTKRGAKPHLEYMFIKVKHLSLFKQFIWKSLAFLSNKFYAHLLLKQKL